MTPIAGRVETAIVGAGQAGLAVGYHLAKRDRPFLILDANERVGDNWRRHYDSLLPVKESTRVEAVSRNGHGYVVDCGDRRVEADNVVVATGTFGRPFLPAFADDLDPRNRAASLERVQEPPRSSRTARCSWWVRPTRAPTSRWTS